jgi:hypothetical protein
VTRLVFGDPAERRANSRVRCFLRPFASQDGGECLTHAAFTDCSHGHIRQPDLADRPVDRQDPRPQRTTRVTACERKAEARVLDLVASSFLRRSNEISWRAEREQLECKTSERRYGCVLECGFEQPMLREASPRFRLEIVRWGLLPCAPIVTLHRIGLTGLTVDDEWPSVNRVSEPIATAAVHDLRVIGGNQAAAAKVTVHKLIGGRTARKR